MGLIVMQQTIMTHGKYFVANHQYEYKSRVNSAIDISLPRLQNQGQVAPQYVVEIDGRDYNIPGCTCVEYDVPLSAEQQNKSLMHEKLTMDSRKDWVEPWEKVSGVKIRRDSGADIDLNQYNQLLSEKDTKMPR